MDLAGGLDRDGSWLLQAAEGLLIKWQSIFPWKLVKTQPPLPKQQRNKHPGRRSAFSKHMWKYLSRGNENVSFDAVLHASSMALLAIWCPKTHTHNHWKKGYVNGKVAWTWQRSQNIWTSCVENGTLGGMGASQEGLHHKSWWENHCPAADNTTVFIWSHT